MSIPIVIDPIRLPPDGSLPSHPWTIRGSVRDNYPRNSPCACGGKRKAKRCCLRGPGEWSKSAARVEPPEPQTGIETAGCYLGPTRNCSGKLSREHPISDCILQQLQANGVVKISGLPWLKKGESRQIPPQELASRILCDRHNHALGPLDDAAGRLMRVIGEYDRDFGQPVTREEIRVFSGEDIERWLLKTACGFVAARQVVRDGRRLDCTLQKHWLPLLQDKASWPSQWGLYVQKTALFHRSRHFTFEAKTNPKDDSLLAVVVTLNNLQFALLLATPDSPAAWGTHRPRTILIKKGRVNKYLELSWPDRDNQKWMLFQHVARTELPPEVLAALSTGAPGRQ